MDLIDKDSVVATIKKHIEEERHSYFCKCLLSEIDSLNVEEQPSLPYDLDEAAEEYADYNCQRWHEDGDVYYDHSKIMDAFKSGAEWMTRQYEKIEGELVDWYSTSDGKDYCCGVKTIDSFEAPEGFYIRKKQ